VSIEAPADESGAGKKVEVEAEGGGSRGERERSAVIRESTFDLLTGVTTASLALFFLWLLPALWWLWGLIFVIAVVGGIGLTIGKRKEGL
jgi:hypothetical protein